MKHIEIAAKNRLQLAGDDSWFDKMSSDQQKNYIDEHPASKFAKNAAKDTDTTESTKTIKHNPNNAKAVAKLKPGIVSKISKALTDGIIGALGETKDGNERIGKALGVGVGLALVGAVKGAIGGAKVSAMVSALSPAIVALTGMSKGAAIGAAIGAAPGVLISVVIGGFMAYKGAQAAKKSFKSHEASDDESKLVVELLDYIDHVSKNGLDKKQLQYLAKHYSKESK